MQLKQGDGEAKEKSNLIEQNKIAEFKRKYREKGDSRDCRTDLAGGLACALLLRRRVRVAKGVKHKLCNSK